jgi:hypothetical protein
VEIGSDLPYSKVSCYFVQHVALGIVDEVSSQIDGQPCKGTRGDSASDVVLGLQHEMTDALLGQNC